MKIFLNESDNGCAIKRYTRNFNGNPISEHINIEFDTNEVNFATDFESLSAQNLNNISSFEIADDEDNVLCSVNNNYRVTSVYDSIDSANGAVVRTASMSLEGVRE